MAKNMRFMWQNTSILTKLLFGSVFPIGYVVLTLVSSEEWTKGKTKKIENIVSKERTKLAMMMRREKNGYKKEELRKIEQRLVDTTDLFRRFNEHEAANGGKGDFFKK